MDNEESPKGPSDKVSDPKGPCTANGEGPEGQGLRPEGSFYSEWRERPGGPVVRSQARRTLLQPMRGPRGALVARSYSHVLFFIFHDTYATCIMPLTVLFVVSVMRPPPVHGGQCCVNPHWDSRSVLNPHCGQLNAPRGGGDGTAPGGRGRSTIHPEPGRTTVDKNTR